MNHVEINYRGTALLVPGWLKPLWPYDLPLHRWPSFCGAGNGFGDWIVPEHTSGVCLSPACFIHDIDWASSPDTIYEFFASNWRFFLNIRSAVLASSLPWWRREFAVVKAYVIWFTAVSTVGALCFDPLGESFVNPLDNPEVQAKLRRLAKARVQWQKDVGI